MSFSLMRSKPEYPVECFDSFPQLGEPWIFGKKLTTPPTGPLEYRLSPDSRDPPYLMYELPHPLMRRSLLADIIAGGADNIEVFDAVLHHPEAGVMRDEYVAFNILGLIATSELAARVMENYLDFEFESDEVDGIVPNYAAIPEGVLLARLADRLGRILIHDSLRERIDPGPESGLVFFALD